MKTWFNQWYIGHIHASLRLLVKFCFLSIFSCHFKSSLVYHNIRLLAKYNGVHQQNLGEVLNTNCIFLDLKFKLVPKQISILDALFLFFSPIAFEVLTELYRSASPCKAKLKLTLSGGKQYIPKFDNPLHSVLNNRNACVDLSSWKVPLTICRGVDQK